jgi:hypothetical protein
MSRLPTIFDDLFPDSSPEFRAIADAWPSIVVTEILSLVWDGFDQVKALPTFRQLDFSKDYAQLERSLTDLHMSEITLIWREKSTSFESFIPQHEPWEFHGLANPSARPPSCDLGFILLRNRRIRWSVEAKVLESADAVSKYMSDLKKFLSGRSSPYSTESAIGAYLISDAAQELFDTLATKMKCELKSHPAFASRPHRYSNHQRDLNSLQAGMPSAFVCHHLAFELS